MYAHDMCNHPCKYRERQSSIHETTRCDVDDNDGLVSDSLNFSCVPKSRSQVFSVESVRDGDLRLTTESEPWVPIDKSIEMGMGKTLEETGIASLDACHYIGMETKSILAT